LKDQVKAILKTRIPVHDPEFSSPEEKTTRVKPDRSKLSPELHQIEDILDRTIRPGLQSDGGDLEVLEFNNNVLKVIYQGACGGCPSALMGTLDAIQNILRHEMDNQNIVVEPI